MKFYINVKAIELNLREEIQTTSYMPTKQIGTDLLKELNLKDEEVSNSGINGIYEHNRICFTITQEEAEKSNLFKNNNEITIKIEECFMMDLFDIVLENGELVYNFNNEKAKQLWIDSNYSNQILEEETLIKLKEKEEEEKKQKEEYKKQKEEKAKQEEEKRIKEEQERINWITEHGSDYLKKCLDNNIKAYPEYVTERAEKEFPDFEIDIDDVASWKELYSPSEQVLNKFILYKNQHPELKIELVYLERDKNECHPREAVVIRNYFGYDLINGITYI
jgi:hypothetical protein